MIPTYRRDQALIDTVRTVLALETRPTRILVMDQSESHDESTVLQLSSWHAEGSIEHIVLTHPSIPASMNEGLRKADSSHVLFIDDDIQPVSDLVGVHLQAHIEQPNLWATVGQVIQPWQIAADVAPPRRMTGLREDFDFPFHSTITADVRNVMAGNLCVHRERALSIGGFDETFSGAAYRFESEFARRIEREAPGSIRFLGSAGLRHLRVAAGGTRSEGSHLTSASPRHGFGDYYYAFRHGTLAEAWTYSCQRVLREVSTRFHATHPWWIPVKMTGELRALWSGWRTAARRKGNQHREEQPGSRGTCE